jgi:hypothetical protein
VQFRMLRPSCASRVVRSLAGAPSLLGVFGLAALVAPTFTQGPGHASQSPQYLTSRSHTVSAAVHTTAAGASSHGRERIGNTSHSATLSANDTLAVDYAATWSVPDTIRAVFGPYAGQAMSVAQCESGFAAGATNSWSGASGVFQFLPSTWAGTSYAGYSPYNAWANVSAAHEVFVRDGYSWGEWSCRP